MFGKLTDTDADLSDVTKAPQWGSHWIYRLFAEFASIWFATFITAGLARGREWSAAIIGGLTLSLVFLASFAFQLADWNYLDAEDYSAGWPEPWYQSAITALMIFVPPFVARYVFEVAKGMNMETPRGFAGINKMHFFWLFFVIHWYAVGLIAPLYALWMRLQSESIIHLLLALIADGIPAAALLVPGFYGLGLLSDHKGHNLHPTLRNLLGVVVLVVGLFIGAATQYLWAVLLQRLFG